MSSFFSKKRIFLKVFLITVSVYIVDIGILLISGNITQGVVVRYAHQASGGSGYPSIKYPVIKYDLGEKEIKFNGNWEAEYERGDTIKVIYKPWRPKKAKIFSFWGIAKKPLIQIIILTAVWAMIYSSFKSPDNNRKISK